jgi:hypothetical protein
MFKKTLFSLLFLFLFLILGLTQLFYGSTAKGIEAYQHLLTFTDQEKRENEIKEFRQTKQKRSNVSKQILYTKDGQRLQSRLTSDHSELVLDQKENRTELIESFENVIFTMQEKLFTEKDLDESERNREAFSSSHQLVRHLVAQKATYFYKNGQLEAKDVELSRYQLPEHHWIELLSAGRPLFKGHAESIQLSILHSPSFRAHQLKATFNDWGND